MQTFILNDKRVELAVAPGTPLIEVIRNLQRLKGTKLACGEGECGACTVLVGRLSGDTVTYHAVTSCITPLINVIGTHVVTIEGLPATGPVHQAMITCDGTQCGFCTPGFVVSMAGALLQSDAVSTETLTNAIDGNICRCTGYKSIVRAAEMISVQFSGKTTDVDALIQAGLLFPYFSNMKERLQTLQPAIETPASVSSVVTGGGTDLYVQKPHAMRKAAIHPVSYEEHLRGISIEDDVCIVRAGTTMTEIMHSPVLQKIIHGIQEYLAPVGSTQIRNMATLGGNIVNASPIGDLTILLLGLDAEIVLYESTSVRTLPLREFYLGYKKMDKAPEAIVHSLRFKIPEPGAQFHFERVCKRTYLDVASVNTACLLHCDAAHTIITMHLSAGGVAPVPLYLRRTIEFMIDKQISTTLVKDAAHILEDEIAPISDIRGSADYKRLVLRHLFYIHMQRLSPVLIDIANLLRA